MAMLSATHASCAVGDCLTSRPKGRLRPRELWFSIYSCRYTNKKLHKTRVIDLCLTLEPGVLPA